MIGSIDPLTSSTASLPEDRTSSKITDERFERLTKSLPAFKKSDSVDSGHCSETEEVENQLVKEPAPVAEKSKAGDLEFPLTQSLLDQVRADESNDDVKSGMQAHRDLHRMGFVINKKRIDHDFVLKLYGQYNHLVSSHGYRSFAIRVFTKMFEYVGAKIPSELILEELITSCNQAGYEAAIYMPIHSIFAQYKLEARSPQKRVISISCNNANHVSIEYNAPIPIYDFGSIEEKYKLNSLLEFTVKLQDGRVEYEHGKVTLTVPEELKKHPNCKSLVDEISEHFTDADNSIIESLTNKFSKGPKSFVEISPQECGNAEYKEREGPVQSTFAQAHEIINFAGELVGAVVEECISELGKTAEAGYKAVSNMQPIREENQEDDGIFYAEDQYDEVVIPESLTFAEIADILNNEIVYDIQDYEDRFITDLNSGNFEKFCSQYLNLDLQGRNDHKHIYDNILYKYKFDAKSNNCNYSAKELVLLAIAANDKLAEKYQNTLFNQKKDKNFDQLLIGVGGQEYIKILSEELTKLLKLNVIAYDRVLDVLKAASFTQNTECMNAVLKLLRGIKPNKRENIGSTPLHFAVQFCDLKTVEILLDNKFDVNVNSNGQTPLHFAVSRGSLEIIELLVDKGANVTEEIVELAHKQLKPVGDQQGNTSKIANLLIAKYAEAPTQEPVENSSVLKIATGDYNKNTKQRVIRYSNSDEAVIEGTRSAKR